MTGPLRRKILCVVVLAAAQFAVATLPARATPTPGSIVWLEIRVLDLARAQAFYSAMLGWTFKPAGPIASLFTAPNIEGMLDQEPGHSVGTSTMIGYFQVQGVRRACNQAVQLGGSIAVTPRPLPGKGSFCVVLDSEGNRLGLMSDEAKP